MDDIAMHVLNIESSSSDDLIETMSSCIASMMMQRSFSDVRNTASSMWLYAFDIVWRRRKESQSKLANGEEKVYKAAALEN